MFSSVSLWFQFKPTSGISFNLYLLINELININNDVHCSWLATRLCACVRTRLNFIPQARLVSAWVCAGFGLVAAEFWLVHRRLRCAESEVCVLCCGGGGGVFQPLLMHTSFVVFCSLSSSVHCNIHSCCCQANRCQRCCGQCCCRPLGETCRERKWCRGSGQVVLWKFHQVLECSNLGQTLR